MLLDSGYSSLATITVLCSLESHALALKRLDYLSYHLHHALVAREYPSCCKLDHVVLDYLSCSLYHVVDIGKSHH